MKKSTRSNYTERTEISTRETTKARTTIEESRTAQLAKWLQRGRFPDNREDQRGQLELGTGGFGTTIYRDGTKTFV